jgi:hypothetical protein
MPEEAVLANLGWAMTPSSSIGDPAQFIGSLPRSVGEANPQHIAGSVSSTDFKMFARPLGSAGGYSRGSVVHQRSPSTAIFGKSSVNMMGGGDADAVRRRMTGRRQISRMPVQLEVRQFRSVLQAELLCVKNVRDKPIYWCTQASYSTATANSF